MASAYLSAPTLVKARFRHVEKDSLPRWTASGSGESAFRQDAAALARQDSVMRFLVEMDRKLETILGLLQRESLEQDFPHEGYVLELGREGMTLESRLALVPGQRMETLLMLGGYPQRLVSVMATVEAESDEDKPRTETGSKLYNLSYVCTNPEDKETIISFIFQEDRKRIRRSKKDEE